MLNHVLPLSVVVPVYNVALYLRQCLDSILVQTRPVQEIICVDDGSTDDSGKILDEYARNHERVRVIHKENAGLVSARKAGIAIVETPYTTYVDSDDWIDANMYEELMEIAVREDADVVTSGETTEFGQGKQTVRVDSAASGLYTGEKLEKLLSKIFSTEQVGEFTFGLSACMKIYRTELLRKFQMQTDDRITLGEDFSVTWPLLLHTNRVYETGKAFYHYRWRMDSMTKSKRYGEEAFEYLLAYLRRQLSPMASRVPNIMAQYHMYEATLWLGTGNMDRFFVQRGEDIIPFGRIPKASRILLYGAGKFGSKVRKWLDQHAYHVVMQVDRQSDGVKVFPPSSISKSSYDILLIGVIKLELIDEIEQTLQQIGVPLQKIRKYDPKYFADRN